MIRDTSTDVGIVGAGGITEYTHAPIVTNTDGLSLSYIADIDRDRARKLKDYTESSIEISDPEELPPCDVAVIAIPLGTREPYHEEFSRRETPVFVEKPFARNETEHEALLDMHEFVFCDYMRTCFSSTRQLRRVVQSEVFGRLNGAVVVESGRVGSTGISTDSYKLDPSVTGGGVLMERGCHSLSQLAVIFDGNLTVADATVDYINSIDVEVSATLKAEFGGRTLPVTYKLSDIHPFDNRSVFAFENGTLVFDQENPESSIECYAPLDDFESWILDADAHENREASIQLGELEKPLEFAYDSAWADDTGEAFFCRWQQFLSVLNDTGEYDVKLRTGREVTRLIREIYE